ncbi:protein of unknown function [Legionella fallonii LLAP-10]|uniref:Uncharacterized protein n=1 Tax=Legionella fallonii LLAP-10 TaxID=1212491 RepID=A0A098G9P8_9GAMM|nr:protein of unknown function [Legionella fallonii LLAP-10]
MHPIIDTSFSTVHQMSLQFHAIIEQTSEYEKGFVIKIISLQNVMVLMSQCIGVS